MKKILLIMGFVMLSQVTHSIEEPAFDLLKTDNDFEIRHYHSHIAASVLSSGTMDDASSAGFRSIADYIFGNNQHRNDGASEKISMTAPVSMQLPNKPDLTEQQLNDSQQQWQVSFFMPAKYQLETLPRPNNERISIKEIAGYDAAVIRFSGFTGSAKVAKKVEQLQQWMADNELIAIGPAQLARYNPPWTLPFFRRNEIIIHIKDVEDAIAKH